MKHLLPALRKALETRRGRDSGRVRAGAWGVAFALGLLVAPVGALAVDPPVYIIGDSLGVGIGLVAAQGARTIATNSVRIVGRPILAQIARVPSGAVAVMSLGTNDAVGNVVNVSTAVTAIVDAARSRNVKLVWVGPPCVFKSWDTSAEALDRNLATQLASAGVAYVSTRGDGYCTRSVRARDGVHFTMTGYRLMWSQAAQAARLTGVSAPAAVAAVAAPSRETTAGVTATARAPAISAMAAVQAPPPRRNPVRMPGARDTPTLVAGPLRGIPVPGGPVPVPNPLRAQPTPAALIVAPPGLQGRGRSRAVLRPQTRRAGAGHAPRQRTGPRALRAGLMAALLVGFSGDALAQAKVAFVGDSMADGLWGGFFRATAREACRGHLDLIRATHNGAGFARADSYDFGAAAAKLVAEQDPDLVVVSIGLNDNQQIITAARERIRLGAPGWEEAYRANVANFYRQITAGGATVLVVGLPVVRDAGLEAHDRMLNQIYAETARGVTRVGYVPPWTLEAAGGEYASFGPGPDGRTVQLRAPDGIHFTTAGYDLLTRYLRPVVAAALAQGGSSTGTCFD